MNTGQYVTSDPFAQPATPDQSPYRLNPGIANGLSPQSAPGVHPVPGTAIGREPASPQ